MQYTRLGSTGLTVSRLCLGMMTYGSKQWRQWVLEEADSLPLIAKAWELGINFFDTADMYSLGVSEEILGRAIKTLGIPRDKIIIATKLYNPMSDDPNHKGLGRKHLHHSIENSLRRLQTDYIDLYQIHRYDYNTPAEEVMDGLDGVVKQGKALYLGASSMYAWQLAKLNHIADKAGTAKFISMQNHYNLAYREEEREMIPFCVDQGLGMIPWSPLGRGLLTGSLKRDSKDSLRAQTDLYAQQIYSRENDFQIADRVAEVAAARGVSRATLALAWVLSNKAVTGPIIGASKEQHLHDAVAALDLKLDPAEITKLEELYEPHPVLGHS
jgi:aryl-alcohol dehydrogenase (NADP+)